MHKILVEKRKKCIEKSGNRKRRKCKNLLTENRMSSICVRKIKGQNTKKGIIF